MLRYCLAAQRSFDWQVIPDMAMPRIMISGVCRHIRIQSDTSPHKK